MERIRSRTTQHPRVSYTGGWNLTGTSQHGYGTPSPPANPLPTLSMGSLTEITTDVVTPGFHRLMQKGSIINNPFRSEKINVTTTPPGYYEHVYYKTNGSYCTLHQPPVYHNLYYKSYGEWRQGHPGTLTMDASLRVAKRQAVIDAAVTQANANIDTSEMLVLASAAESGKTVESMRNILWRLYKIMKKVRRLDLAALSRELSPKELADRYMEARYAIRPLLYDARGIARSFQEERGHSRRTFRGSADDSYELNETVSDVAFGLYLTLGSFTKNLKYTVSARSGVLCDINVTDLSIYGIDQIVETAWELAPFSFIVDWFVGVGDWIAAHTPNAGVRQLASWVTVSENHTATTTATSHRSIANTAGFVNVSLTMPPFWTKREELVLERLVNPVAPTLPLVNLKLDTWKLTDLGIILRNLTR